MDRDLSVIKEGNPHLAGLVELSVFLGDIGELSIEDRRTILSQAVILLEDVYVHLPLKKAMHAIDPVQALKLLKRRLPRLTERQFHSELIEIFKGLRDLHTNYILPAPYNQHTAFLPFLLEEYYDANGERHYLVSRWIRGFQHATFIAGVEVTDWSGVPIDRAVAINADREAGSNEAARHVRGLDAMTVRPMAMSLPPNAEWVIIGYQANGESLEIKLPWRVFRPDTNGTASGKNAEAQTAIGLDLNMELLNEARKALFAKSQESIYVLADNLVAEVDREGAELPTEMAGHSLFPRTFQFSEIETDEGPVGYLRIRTFGSPGPPQFISEVVRILEGLPQDGLIIDVRGNGGGIIINGERMLQLFTAGPVEAERLHFINSELTLAIASSPQWQDAHKWKRSIDLSVATGAVYSQGFPIESRANSNSIGQKYHGPVVLITDGRCYSTTDIFAAGFQDNKLGKILGVDGNTGAGGANVFEHRVLRQIMPGSDSPFKELPGGANMRVAIRRTTRVKENAGLPVEDVGIEPDTMHRMTRDDILGSNADLIAAAVKLLRNP